MTDGISDDCQRGRHMVCLRCPACTCHGKTLRAEAAAETAMRGVTWHPGQDDEP